MHSYCKGVETDAITTLKIVHTFAIRSSYVSWCTTCAGSTIDAGEGPAEAVVTDPSLHLVWFVLGVAAICVGVPLCSVGQRFVTFTLAFTGFINGFIFTFAISCGIVGLMIENMIGAFVSISIAIVPATFLAMLLPAYPTIGTMCMGATGGFIIALILNGTVLHLLYSIISPEIAVWIPFVLNISFAFIGLVLGIWKSFGTYIIIWTSSFGGVYLVIWGALQVAKGNGKSSMGSHLNPIVLFAGETWDLDMWYYLAIVGIALGGVVMACIQQYMIHIEDPCTDANSGYSNDHAPDDSKSLLEGEHTKSNPADKGKYWGFSYSKEEYIHPKSSKEVEAAKSRFR